MKLGTTIWYCHRIKKRNAEYESFDKPIKEILRMPSVFNRVSITIQPRNGFTDRPSEGETNQAGERVILQPYDYWNGKFNVGDVFYLYDAKPSDNEEYYGEYANYMVENVGNQNLAIELLLKKIIEK